MANTADLQEAIDWVRGELSRRYEKTFSKLPVRLRAGATRSFNAVSADQLVVATVMNSSGPTSGGKKPVGKIRSAIAEVYFLSLANARERVLIMTDHSFYEYVVNELAGALVDEVRLEHIPLPPDLAARVAGVTASASAEMSG